MSSSCCPSGWPLTARLRIRSVAANAKMPSENASSRFLGTAYMVAQGFDRPLVVALCRNRLQPPERPSLPLLLLKVNAPTDPASPSLHARRAPGGNPSLLLAYQADGPEVGGQAWLDQVRVRDREVAANAPVLAPRVAHQEPLARVVVAHRHHGVTADWPLAPHRHRRMAAPRHGLGFEALVNREAEDEWIAGREAALHLVQVLHQARVLHRAVELGVPVRAQRRLGRELRDVVGPLRLGARSDARDSLYAVADLRAAVRPHRVLDDALVVVDEEARRHEDGELLLHLIELDRPADGVRRAAAEGALVVDRRAPAPEVGARRQRGEKLRRRGVQVVALVGLVRDPAVAADLARLGHDLSSLTARRSPCRIIAGALLGLPSNTRQCWHRRVWS